METAFGSYPLAYRSGWGYLLLTWGLWNQGNGPFTLYAFAYDQDGHSTTLGTKTITVDNAHAVKPFGALDVPAYGETDRRYAPNTQEIYRQVNGMARRVAETNGLLFVDRMAVTDSLSVCLPGSIRLSAHGHRVMADVLLEALVGGQRGVDSSDASRIVTAP